MLASAGGSGDAGGNSGDGGAGSTSGDNQVRTTIVGIIQNCLVGHAVLERAGGSGNTGDGGEAGGAGGASQARKTVCDLK